MRRWAVLHLHNYFSFFHGRKHRIYNEKRRVSSHDGGRKIDTRELRSTRSADVDVEYAGGDTSPIQKMSYQLSDEANLKVPRRNWRCLWRSLRDGSHECFDEILREDSKSNVTSHTERWIAGAQTLGNKNKPLHSVKGHRRGSPSRDSEMRAWLQHTATK